MVMATNTANLCEETNLQLAYCGQQIGRVSLLRPNFPTLGKKDKASQCISFLGTTGSGSEDFCLSVDRRDLLEHGRQADAEGAADRIDAGARGGAQQRASSVLFDLDGTQIGQVIDHA